MTNDEIAQLIKLQRCWAYLLEPYARELHAAQCPTAIPKLAG